MINNNIDEDTYNIIKMQLGRKPENIAGVAKYCPQNQPLVIFTYPFREGKGIFPTIYWLSCPNYVKEVDRIEDSGLIDKLTMKLHNDFNFKEKMESAHRDYARKRMLLINKDDIKNIEKLSPDILKVLKESGVGGIRDRGGIKCLHTHLAHYLVDKANPAGEIVYQKLPPLNSCQGCEL